MTLYIPVPIEKSFASKIKNKCDMIFNKIVRYTGIALVFIIGLSISTAIAATIGHLLTMPLWIDSDHVVTFWEMFTLPVPIVFYVTTDIYVSYLLIKELNLVELRFKEDQSKDIIGIKPL